MFSKTSPHQIYNDIAGILTYFTWLVFILFYSFYQHFNLTKESNKFAFNIKLRKFITKTARKWNIQRTLQLRWSAIFLEQPTFNWKSLSKSDHPHSLPFFHYPYWFFHSCPSLGCILFIYPFLLPYILVPHYKYSPISHLHVPSKPWTSTERPSSPFPILLCRFNAIMTRQISVKSIVSSCV